ncbi:MAG: histidine ammonia-lyase [Syntrophomonadaceae bacterium]|nr:histidine ammonia-lyase [Syntrophomonadaceae bacterium]
MGYSSGLVEIDGEKLLIPDVVQVARHGTPVAISEAGKHKLELARTIIDRLVTQNVVTYGVNTGFGKLSDVIISPEQTGQLQYNLITSHAGGVGEPFEEEIVRAILLLRANTLTKGYSGISTNIVETMIRMLNAGVHPLIPKKGSVGASGDLAPLAHMALVLIGEGEAFFQGQRLAGRDALQKAGLRPVTLKAKEGLALINGTQVMGALATIGVHDAEQLFKIANISAAITIEALGGITAAFDKRLHVVRPHPGQIKCAEQIMRLLSGSKLMSQAVYGRVQDAYSLRCIPQVHGASWDALEYTRRVIEIEINSATDNPLVFPDQGEVVSGGNFHGQPLALAADFLAMAVAEIGNIAERRIERLVNPQLSGLPAFLAQDSGLNSGLMIGQYTAAALVSENKILASPACVDSIPTSANQEDHVSMGSISTRKLRDIIQHTCYILAIELLCGCQAMEFRPKAMGRGTVIPYQLIRKVVPPLTRDRPIHGDIEAVYELIMTGKIVSEVEKEIGLLT